MFRPSIPLNPAGLMLLGLVSLSCAESEGKFDADLQPEPTLASLFDGSVTVLDLTHTLNKSNPVWGQGAESPFAYDVHFAHESGKAVMGAFKTADHYGTHLDAPIHGGDLLKTVDELEPSDLFGPLAVIDISDASAADQDYALSISDIEAWEAEHGQIPERAMVLANTGWGLKWNDHAAYLGRDEDGDLHFPGFSAEAARFLVTKRSIMGIGIDNMSVDPGASDGFPAHSEVNGSGYIHLENVANVHLLPPSGAYLIAAPVKVEGGSGGPVRLFGVVP